jgi:hypothetical protein
LDPLPAMYDALQLQHVAVRVKERLERAVTFLFAREETDRR